MIAPPSKSPNPIPWHHRRLLHVLVPLVLTAITFAPALTNTFTNWDDPDYVTNNILIQSLAFKNICHIFSPGTFVSANYHPVTILSLALNYAAGRLNPAGYIATNILLHLFNVLLVFLLIRRLSGNGLVASLTAILFGIHPMHVESVAWIAGRKDVLAAFFYLAGLYWYCRYRESKSALPFAFTFVLFILSLLSKAVGVTFPILCLLLDFHAGRKCNARSIIEKIPFFAASLVFGVLAIHAQASERTLNFGYTVPLVNRLFIVCYSYAFYIIRFFAPVHLSAFYPYPDSLPASVPLLYKLSPLFALATAGAVFYFRRSRVVLFGFFFFLLSIALLLHFSPVGATITTDRYSYLPYIGFSFIAAHFFWKGLSGRPGAGVPPLAVAGLCIGMIAIFSYGAWNRCKVWKDSGTLWTDVIANYANVPMAFNNRGTFFAKKAQDLYDQGNSGAGALFLEKAIRDFSTVIAADSAVTDNPYKKTCCSLAYNNRGSAYSNGSRNSPTGNGLDTGLLIRAISDISHSIVLNPRSVQAYQNRAFAYGKLGLSDSAIADYGRSIALDSVNPEIWFDRGQTFGAIQRPDRAIEDFSRALMLDPQMAKAYNERGIAYAQTGMYGAAKNDFASALSLNPGDPEIMGNWNHVMTLLQSGSQPAQQ